MRKKNTLRRAARLVQAAVRETTQPGLYNPTEAWHNEVLELKTVMRKGFQLLTYNQIQGDYAEFGVCGARTFTQAWGAAQLSGYPAHFWAFDSFKGLPSKRDPRDEHPKWPAGEMSMSEAEFRRVCREQGIPENSYTTVPGFYSETLAPKATGARPERISFAYIDCDLYSSTLEVLQFLGPHLRSGMVISFDDWYCFTEDQSSGERLAAATYFDDNDDWRLVPFVQYGWHGMSFIVERVR